MYMSTQYITIRLDNAKIYLAEDISLTYDKTNLPKHAFSFKTERPLFWKLKLKDYDPASCTLTVNVVDYTSNTTILVGHETKYPIEILKFEKLDWKKFEPLIYSYTLGRLKNSIFNYRDKLLDLNDRKDEDVKLLKRTAPNLFFNERLPIKEEIEIDVKVKYEEATFDNSKIRFFVHLKPYKLVKELEIANSHLRSEFEHIKPYFIKRLGKYFLAKIKLTLLDSEVDQIVAKSDDINNIDENLINSMRVASTLDLRHFKTERTDKALYDAKELLADVKKMSLATNSATQVLEIFIENAKIRNLRQLEHLARDKQSLNERVQFTIRPLFGFVFHELGNKQCLFGSF
jgi:hypothetical protein